MKKRISVESIQVGEEQTRALVVAWEKQKVGEEMQETPLGEETIAFDSKLPKPEVIPLIKEAAQRIAAKAKEAKTTREELNKLLEKEVIE